MLTVRAVPRRAGMGHRPANDRPPCPLALVVRVVQSQRRGGPMTGPRHTGAGESPDPHSRDAGSNSWPRPVTRAPAFGPSAHTVESRRIGSEFDGKPRIARDWAEVPRFSRRCALGLRVRSRTRNTTRVGSLVYLHRTEAAVRIARGAGPRSLPQVQQFAIHAAIATLTWTKARSALFPRRAFAFGFSSVGTGDLDGPRVIMCRCSDEDGSALPPKARPRCPRTSL